MAQRGGKPRSMEVDIHGLMVSDAKARLEHLLSNAGPQVEEVVVIHGYSRGTVLRDMVRNQLKHPRIQSKLLSLNQGQTRILLKKGKKYIQISTDEVYGSLSRDYIEAKELHLDEGVKKVVEGRDNLKTYGDKFFTEETPLDPRSPYSSSKASGDMIVRAYAETYKLPINITRCSNNYGPYQFPEKLIPLIIKNILEGKSLPVYGDGSNVRDWLYVRDHNKAVDMVINSGRLGEVYNIGGFNEEKNINIVKLTIDTIAKIMREEPEYRKVLKTDIENINYNLITYVQDRLGHDARYAIDPTKIATELGWYPETPFDKGIEKTIRWYLDSQEWSKNED